MKVNELINRLEVLKEKFGNIEVRLEMDDTRGEFEETVWLDDFIAEVEVFGDDEEKILYISNNSDHDTDADICR